jgi:hypothetical protein
VQATEAFFGRLHRSYLEQMARLYALSLAITSNILVSADPGGKRAISSAACRWIAAGNSDVRGHGRSATVVVPQPAMTSAATSDASRMAADCGQRKIARMRVLSY